MSPDTEPLVIGLDSSTQSTKAIAWDRRGRAVAVGRAPIALANPRLDCFEQDPEDWWISCCTALNECVAQVGAGRIAALAISNQRETMAFLDKDGASIHPAITWLDERARAEVAELSDTLGGETIHRITGRPPDITPCLYSLLWIKKHKPDVWARTVCFADVQCYLVHRLAGGPYRTGWTSADPTGLFDVTEMCWSPVILTALDLDEGRLPRTHAPGAALGRVSEGAAAVTGLHKGTPIFAAGGDGQCAGLGTNCTMPERAYVNLGTAVVSGVWSPHYRYDRAWRTELAAQGEGYIYENCLRSGAFLVNWFVTQFVPGGRDDPRIFDKLEAEALKLPVGSEGLMVQPYWSGVMDPHWDMCARGVVFGLGGSHTPVHVYRAIIEGITLDQVIRTRSLETAAGQNVDHYVAIGGGAASPLWRQMLADASGKPVLISDTLEASALGAGMIAAFGAGWYGSIPEAAAQMAGKTHPVEPNRGIEGRYRELLGIYKDLYDTTRLTNQRLVALSGGGSA